MRYVICCIGLIFVFSCNSNSETKTVKEETTQERVYDMYEPSEMANLMNQMYAEKLVVKNEIIAGNRPTEFPSDFLNIHTAELSDFKKRNAKFEAFSKLYISAELEVYNADSNIPLEERFNTAVGLCISCHQTECTGPIPRIKKLLIK